MKSDNLIRKRTLLELESAVKDAVLASDVEHSGLSGQIREILVSRILRPFLPSYVDFGKGKFTTITGELSSETDIILYSKDVLPASLYDTSLGIFPIEAGFYSIEVKTTLTATELRKSLRNASALRRLKPILENICYVKSEENPTLLKRITSPTPIPISVLFAFRSDKQGNLEGEIERYNQIASEFGEKSITAICIVEKGYFTHDDFKIVSTGNSEEIVFFISGIRNTLTKFKEIKGDFPLEGYLFPQNL